MSDIMKLFVDRGLKPNYGIIKGMEILKKIQSIFGYILPKLSKDITLVICCQLRSLF